MAFTPSEDYWSQAHSSCSVNAREAGELGGVLQDGGSSAEGSPCLAGCREGKAGWSAVVLPLPPSSSSAGRAFVCPAGALSLGSRCGSRCESGRPPVTAPHVTPGAINSWAAGRPASARSRRRCGGRALRGSRPGRPAHGGSRTPVGAGEPGCGRRGPGLEDTPGPYPYRDGPYIGMAAPLAGWVGNPAEVRELCALTTPHHRSLGAPAHPRATLPVLTAQSPELRDP